MQYTKFLESSIMCGIIGVVAQRNIINILLDSLYRLEYRGYDSSGLAIINNNGQLIRLRRLGKVDELVQAIKEHSLYNSKIGLAHTRWATHGTPSENNAHPHISEHIAIVHNGIIENYQSLRTTLQMCGYAFTSDTDTEVIAHLIHWEQTCGVSLFEAVLRAIKKLRGTYGLVIMNSYNPTTLFAVRFRSPIVIGLGIGENFIASDQLALLPITSNFIVLEEGDIAEVTCSSVKIFNTFGKEVMRKNTKLNLRSYDIMDIGVYHHYMQKEIYEQPNAVQNTVSGRINHGMIDFNELSIKFSQILTKVEHIQITACGTSYNSGMVSSYWFESLANIHCDVETASEFRYRKSAVRRNSLMIAISQSGETADTLAALQVSKKFGYLSSLAICNVFTSSLVRESDFVLMTKAGIEICVASTKAFTTQLTVLLMLVAKLAYIKGNINASYAIINELQVLSHRIKSVLSLDQRIKKLAKNFANKYHALFLGRGNQYPIALEGALKLKEISYIHAEAYPAGELKHGPLALVDSNMPVIVIAPNNELLEKLKSNIEEIRARKGQLYVFTDHNSSFVEDDSMHIIKMPYIESIIAPILYVIPLQLLAYHVALIKGTDIDRPRNLAKSVTVE